MPQSHHSALVIYQTVCHRLLDWRELKSLGPSPNVGLLIIHLKFSLIYLDS